jgi:hypothetical protein
MAENRTRLREDVQRIGPNIYALPQKPGRPMIGSGARKNEAAEENPALERSPGLDSYQPLATETISRANAHA